MKIFAATIYVIAWIFSIGSGKDTYKYINFWTFKTHTECVEQIAEFQKLDRAYRIEQKIPYKCLPLEAPEITAQ